MKIRNGFVSNSSSSSFILMFDEIYPDTVSIAESMLRNKFEEWDDYGRDKGDEQFEKKVFKNLEKFKEKHYDANTPMFFKSTNYDTYILPITENYVLIETCNNTQWDVADDACMFRELPKEILDKYPQSEGHGRSENYITSGEKDSDGYGINVIYNIEYYLIEDGVFMVSPGGYQSCKNNGCYSDIWYFGGVQYCMTCDRDKLMRSMKIKKIKNGIKQD